MCSTVQIRSACSHVGVNEQHVHIICLRGLSALGMKLIPVPADYVIATLLLCNIHVNREKLLCLRSRLLFGPYSCYATFSPNALPPASGSCSGRRRMLNLILVLDTYDLFC